jgi:hypothetical protein
MKIPTQSDLIIFTTEDGEPWAAFVWGEAQPATVAAPITAEAVEDATGYDAADIEANCSWPPRVQTYHLRQEPDEDMYEFCKPSDPGAQLITGHRFYPQG